ncbi:MAG: metal-dependent hydrolase [Acidimicrobiia bacterium]|nr:MAG: metal-dependent hydrolase [Acidimicrobiia bacterium]
MTTTQGDRTDADSSPAQGLPSAETVGDVEVRFLGTAAFEIVTANGIRILIDPFLEENLESPIKIADLENVDLLMVTHAAYDHLGDTLKIMQRWPDITCVAGVDVRGYLIASGIDAERIWSSPWGMMIEVADVTIRPVYSRHWSYIEGPDGTPYSCIPMAYIIYASDACRIYHSGDTALFSDMKLIGELYEPTIGLINVGFPRNHFGAKHGAPVYLTGEMDAREAAMAVEWLGLQTAIPCHHDDIELPEIVEFAARVTAAGHSDVELLSPGEYFRVSP